MVLSTLLLAFTPFSSFQVSPGVYKTIATIGEAYLWLDSIGHLRWIDRSFSLSKTWRVPCCLRRSSCVQLLYWLEIPPRILSIHSLPPWFAVKVLKGLYPPPKCRRCPPIPIQQSVSTRLIILHMQSQLECNVYYIKSVKSQPDIFLVQDLLQRAPNREIRRCCPNATQNHVLRPEALVCTPGYHLTDHNWTM